MVLNLSPLIGRGLTDALNLIFCALFIFIRKANISSDSEGTFAIIGYLSHQRAFCFCSSDKLQYFCPQIQTILQWIFFQSSLNLTLIQNIDTFKEYEAFKFHILSVLSFADKPKLTYLTIPTKKGGKTRKLSAKINTNSNMRFESKMNLKSILVCSKSIKITAILIIFFRWLKYS